MSTWRARPSTWLIFLTSALTRSRPPTPTPLMRAMLVGGEAVKKRPRGGASEVTGRAQTRITKVRSQLTGDILALMGRGPATNFELGVGSPTTKVATTFVMVIVLA